MTLLISIALVIVVVFIFLRNARATLIPGIAVPVSLLGTFAVMYMFGYSLDNLSLMALTISTGFVVDDAIVVMENVSRHLEDGMKPFPAALKGAEEIGFTVFTISISLVAVFIPLLLMGGIVGRLFREFAITLSAAIVVSMMISLTTTPMMCAYLLRNEHARKHVDLSGQRKKRLIPPLCLSAHSPLGAGQSDFDAFGAVHNDRPERRSGHQDSKGLFPNPGHRCNYRRSSRTLRIPLFSGDGRFNQAIVGVMRKTPVLRTS